MRLWSVLVVMVLSLFATAIQAAPTATEVVVRAKARDAKFIGTSVGGAWVRIRDADSGAVLTEGITEGGTGNTDLIMKAPKTRYSTLGDGAAAFKATLMLERPTLVTVEVLAPYIKRQARTVSQTQVWLIPGKPMPGDGLVVEVPGMIVDILGPGTHLYTSLKQAPFEIKANVVMMCGCILTAGGLWDGNKMEVAALIERDGQPYRTLPLAMQEQMNTFLATFTPDAPGSYHITVYAYDPQTGNTGVDQTSFVVAQ
jgi:hypothetical protein